MSKDTITVTVQDVYSSDIKREYSIAELDIVRAVLVAESNKAIDEWKTLGDAADLIDEEDANTYAVLTESSAAALDKANAIDSVLSLLFNISVGKAATISR